MSDSGNGGQEGKGGTSGAVGGPNNGEPALIGGVVRDPRGTGGPRRRSLTGYALARVRTAIGSVLEGVGLKRVRNADGTLQPRAWKRLGIVTGSAILILFVWTSVHIVQPGTVAVPITLGHPGKPLGPGIHITLPLTTTYGLTVRTQNYTMTSNKGEGARANTDDSVSVLGADGGAAQVNATVLFRLDSKQATNVYRELGTGYANAIVRPSARACIRSEFTNQDMVNAATTSWHAIELRVTKCMKAKIEPRGLQLQDFQLREVTLSTQLQNAVNAKVAAQQNAEQQKFDLSTAEQMANITRVQALATADSQQILACGGHLDSIRVAGKTVQEVVPNKISQCSQAQLTPQYLQYTYIQALKQLVNSPNNSTIILPFDKNLTPLLNVGNNASTPGTTTTPTSAATTP